MKENTPLCRERQGSQVSLAPMSHVGKGKVHHCPPSGLNTSQPRQTHVHKERDAGRARQGSAEDGLITMKMGLHYYSVCVALKQIKNSIQSSNQIIVTYLLFCTI